MAQNSLRHSSTNLSPFQCLLGYQPVLAPWHQGQTDIPAVDDWFRRAEETWEAAHVHLQRVARRQNASADRPHSESPVFAPLPAMPEAGSAFCGAIKVLRRLNEVCNRLQLPSDYRINPSFHVSLRPVVAGPLQESVVRELLPPPLDIEGDPAYIGGVRARGAGFRLQMFWILNCCGSITVAGRILRLILRLVPEAGVGALLEPRVNGRGAVFRRSRLLSLFGRRSAIDVTGFLAIATPFFIYPFVLSCFHTHLVFISPINLLGFNPLFPILFCV